LTQAESAQEWLELIVANSDMALILKTAKIFFERVANTRTFEQ
jgi:hypothetical protein